MGVEAVAARARALLHQAAGLYWLRQEEPQQALAQFDIADRYIQQANEDEASLTGRDADAFRTNSAYYRSLAYFQNHQIDETHEQLNLVRDIARRVQWKRAETYAEAGIGCVFIRMGGDDHLSAAETLLNRALEILDPEDDGQRVTDRRGASHVRHYLGELNIARKNRPEALRHLESAERGFSDIGLKYNASLVRRIISRYGDKCKEVDFPLGW